jgi:hypothetical protein
MQTATIRCIVLSVVLLVGAALYAMIGQPQGVGTPRWPSASDPLYLLNGWASGPLHAEQINTAEFISCDYQSPHGLPMTLTIETYQTPKLYAAAPEVPFLGSGYSIASPPADMAPGSDEGVGSLVAQRGDDDRWLVMYAYGERRGLLGNGPLAWSFAVSDLLLGRANDYYKLYVTAHVSALDPQVESDVAEFARTMFPRVQQWYAGPA